MVPAWMAGKRLKCPQCGTSVAAARMTQPCPSPVIIPDHRETISPSGLETATRPGPLPATASPGEAVGHRPLLLVGLVVAVVALLVVGAVALLSRPDGQAGKDAGGLPETITNDLKMRLVLIRAGTFNMVFDYGFDDEKAPHDVRITRAFYMAATETTKGQFRQFVKE